MYRGSGKEECYVSWKVHLEDDFLAKMMRHTAVKIRFESIPARNGLLHVQGS